MLIKEQSDLVKALLATAGFSAATEFEIHAGWLIVDGVPHRVHAEALDAPAPAKAAPAKPTAPAVARKPKVPAVKKVAKPAAATPPPGSDPQSPQ